MPYVSTRLEYTGQLTLMTCWRCAIHYGVPEDFRTRRQQDGESFYCPNGHGAVFRETEADRLRREVVNLEADREWYKAELTDKERRLSATRGVVTKLRKRAHAGTCPFGCRRHFVDLERHVASKHPGATLEGE